MSEEEKRVSGNIDGGGNADLPDHTHECPIEPPFVGVTIEPFNRFHPIGVNFECGKFGVVACNIPRYLSTNFHFDKENMVPAGKKFVMLVVEGSGIVPVSIID